jgi:hypothetical protein
VDLQTESHFFKVGKVRHSEGHETDSALAQRVLHCRTNVVCKIVLKILSFLYLSGILRGAFVRAGFLRNAGASVGADRRGSCDAVLHAGCGGTVVTNSERLGSGSVLALDGACLGAGHVVTHVGALLLDVSLEVVALVGALRGRAAAASGSADRVVSLGGRRAAVVAARLGRDAAFGVAQGAAFGLVALSATLLHARARAPLRALLLMSVDGRTI